MVNSGKVLSQNKQTSHEFWIHCSTLLKSFFGLAHLSKCTIKKHFILHALKYDKQRIVYLESVKCLFLSAKYPSESCLIYTPSNELFAHF